MTIIPPNTAQTSEQQQQPLELTFNRVFNVSKQDELYRETTHSLIQSFVKGDDSNNDECNATVFTYGSVNSGKTHTILGNDHDPGVLVRALQGIFYKIGAKQTPSNVALALDEATANERVVVAKLENDDGELTDSHQYAVSVSLLAMERNGDKFVDILPELQTASVTSTSSGNKFAKRRVDLRPNSINNELILKQLRKQRIHSAEEGLELYKFGSKTRKDWYPNAHLLFTITLVDLPTDFTPDASGLVQNASVRRFVLCDLATIDESDVASCLHMNALWEALKSLRRDEEIATEWPSSPLTSYLNRQLRNGHSSVIININPTSSDWFETRNVLMGACLDHIIVSNTSLLGLNYLATGTSVMVKSTIKKRKLVDMLATDRDVDVMGGENEVIAEKQEEIEYLRYKIQQLEKESTKRGIEYEAVMKENAELKTRIESDSNVINEVSLEDNEHLLNELYQKLETTNSENTTLLETVRHLESELTIARNNMADVTKTMRMAMDNLTQENTELKSQLSQVEQIISLTSDLNDRIMELESAKEEREALIASLTQTLEAANQRIVILEADTRQNSTLNEDMETLYDEKEAWIKSYGTVMRVVQDAVNEKVGGMSRFVETVAGDIDQKIAGLQERLQKNVIVSKELKLKKPPATEIVNTEPVATKKKSQSKARVSKVKEVVVPVVEANEEDRDELDLLDAEESVGEPVVVHAINRNSKPKKQSSTTTKRPQRKRAETKKKIVETVSESEEEEEEEEAEKVVVEKKNEFSTPARGKRQQKGGRRKANTSDDDSDYVVGTPVPKSTRKAPVPKSTAKKGQKRKMVDVENDVDDVYLNIGELGIFFLLDMEANYFPLTR